MKKWKLYLPILLCFICVLGGLIWSTALVGQQDITPSDIQFRDESHNISLVPYYDEVENAYYLFLPACTAPSDLTVLNPITLGSVPFSLMDTSQDADKSAPSPEKAVMVLTLSQKNYTVSLWQCDNLPTLFLQGKRDMLAKVHNDKFTKVSTYITILDESGEVLLQDLGSLSGRGNGTWAGSLGTGQPKRPYNLDFSTPVAYGPYKDITTLCLFGEYSDESKLRNSLVYYAGLEMGQAYASPYTYINVYINGKYMGLYGTATKQEYSKHLEEDQILDIFECTGYYGIHSFYTSISGQSMRLYYGDVDRARDVANFAENALIRRDWPQCEKLLDLDSFALMYALEEFFCNLDMTYASQYFYTTGEDVIHTMLPWDFDFSMGSAATHFNPHQDRAIVAYRNIYDSSWYPILLEYDGFRQRVANIIVTYFTDEFLEKLSSHLLQDIQTIDNSRLCEIRRWESFPPYSEYPLFSGMDSLIEFYDFFTDFFPKRRDFLLDYFRNFDDYCCITLRPDGKTWFNNVCIPKGNRPSDYIDEEAFFRRAFPDDPAGKILVTESGIPLSELDAVTEDITLISAEP